MIEGARWSYIRAYEYVGGKGSYTQGLKDI
jgi:hypothetical protein